MVRAKEIYDYIDSIAPFGTAMDFDNVGLLIGSKEKQTQTVLTALDASARVIDEAVSLGAGIIVTHHPVIFNPLRRIEEQSAVYKAVQSGITIISAHTNLDIAHGGVNETLAETAGVWADVLYPEDCAVFGPFYDPIDCRRLAARLKKRLDLPGLRYTDPGREIRTALVSCGAGGHNIFLAKKCGADVLITGEIKHHELVFAYDNDIAVFDLGHFGSEHIIIPKLAAMFAAQFPDAEFRVSQADRDKTEYFSQE